MCCCNLLQISNENSIEKTHERRETATMFEGQQENRNNNAFFCCCCSSSSSSLLSEKRRKERAEQRRQIRRRSPSRARPESGIPNVLPASAITVHVTHRGRAENWSHFKSLKQSSASFSSCCCRCLTSMAE